MNNVSPIINNMKINFRKDNRYEGRITIHGKRKSFYGTTKTEVKQKAKEYIKKVENGYKEPEKIFLNDYIEYWLNTFKKNKIEPSSYSRLYQTYEKQIKDDLGKKYIGNITASDIQQCIDEHSNPSSNITKALSISGLKKIIHLLRPCLNKAVEEGIIDKNPCDNVILPVESCVTVQTKEQFSLSDKEIELFRNESLSLYKSTKEYKSRNAFILLLMLNLGLRVGEMIALEWDDINIENKIMYVNKTLQTIKSYGNNSTNKTRIKKSTKTISGNRVLPLNEISLFYITELQEYDKRHNIKSSHVCCTKVGTRETPRNLQRSLDRIIDKTDIDKKVTLHTLRHTFGSVLIRRGIGVEVVSKLMGHANITITYNKYIHVIQEQKAKAMNMINIC